MKNEDTVLRNIAKHSLDCIEKVSSTALEEERQRQNQSPSSGAGNLAQTNTFTDSRASDNLRQNSRDVRENLSNLIEEPIIARVDYTDENNVEKVIYITRRSSISLPDAEFQIASSRSSIGRLASMPAGSDGIISINGHELEFLIETSAKLNPRREDDGQWDSRNSKVDIKGRGITFEPSLRKLLETPTDVEYPDLDAPWADDDDNIVDGLRKSILNKMSLRDQPILDQYQDEIFRLPINMRCFLLGPPGTGKTTTLIRRLGQKTDMRALEDSDENLEIIKRVERETGTPHEDSWIVFSPTELLRQYVKDAFNREGLPASNEHLRTWEKFRKELAREQLGLLRTGDGKGPFVNRQKQDYLLDGNNEAEWYEDFRNYLDASIAEELNSDVKLLVDSTDSELNAIGCALKIDFETRNDDFYAHTINSVKSHIPKIKDAIEVRKSGIEKILIKTRNALTHEDKNFPNLLQEELTLQLAKNTQEVDDNDELDDVLNDDDEKLTEPQAVGQRISKRRAQALFEKALKSLARSRVGQRKASPKSQNGMLLLWLGSERIPTDEDLLKMGKLLDEQSRLRKFERLERLCFRYIPVKYKKFRTERAKSECWYKSVPGKASDIFWQELDLVILATLQIANEILALYRELPGAEFPTIKPLANVLHTQKAQILVDEATDFSQLQLASMNALAHPALGSIFLCGDMNQRLTSWGLKSSEALDWIASDIKQKSITVSYRQTQHLVDLAKEIAVIGGANSGDIILPEYLDSKGPRPVWQTNLSNDKAIAEWLSERIGEIERKLQQATTIAVLVNEEAQVEPLAEELNKLLEEISLSAVACKDGQVVGNDQDVRVFDIKHIKGLEFEAVFFVNLDQTIQNYQDLFPKYLYVGATRAATYLGVTFQEQVPLEVRSLSHHFGEDWA